MPINHYKKYNARKSNKIKIAERFPYPLALHLQTRIIKTTHDTESHCDHKPSDVFCLMWAEYAQGCTYVCVMYMLPEYAEGPFMFTDFTCKTLDLVFHVAIFC